MSGKAQKHAQHGALVARKLPALSSGRWHHVQLSGGPCGCWSQKCGLSRGVITCRMYAEKEDDGKPSQQVLEHLRIRWTQVFSLGSEDITRCARVSSVSRWVEEVRVQFKLCDSFICSFIHPNICMGHSLCVQH